MKLKITELTIKSFITEQTDHQAKTIKAGSNTNTLAAQYDSDGPPYTSSNWTEINCATKLDPFTCSVPE